MLLFEMIYLDYQLYYNLISLQIFFLRYFWFRYFWFSITFRTTTNFLFKSSFANLFILTVTCDKFSNSLLKLSYPVFRILKIASFILSLLNSLKSAIPFVVVEHFFIFLSASILRFVSSTNIFLKILHFWFPFCKSFFFKFLCIRNIYTTFICSLCIFFSIINKIYITWCCFFKYFIIIFITLILTASLVSYYLLSH